LKIAGAIGNMRKVHAAVVVKVIMTLDDGVEVGTALDEMNYQFNISEEHGFIEDTEIVDFEVVDSK
jgi:hypothetical protein